MMAKGVSMRAALKVNVCLTIFMILTTALLTLIGGCTKEKVVIYGEIPGKVTLISPPNSVDSIYVSAPAFRWAGLSNATGYHLQIASDIVFTGIIIGVDVADTFYSASQSLNNGTYYWRVRAKNDKGVWGDWSDASIWTFKINDSSNYIRLLSQTTTLGVPQDVFLENNLAYIADGEAMLTIFDISDPASPVFVGNLDSRSDDIAKGVWKRPGDNYAYVADLDAKIQVVDVSLPLDPYAMGNSTQGLDQNLEDLTGVVYQDSVFILSVASGNRNLFRLYNMTYDPLPHTNPNYSVNEILLPSDGMGLCFDTMSVHVQYHDTLKMDSSYIDSNHGRFVCIAAASSGLVLLDLSFTHPFAFPDSVVNLMGGPRVIGMGDTPGSALSVQMRGKYAYIADDRSGLQIFRLPDTIPSYDNVTPFEANPVLISSINTSGRTKDLQLVGDYCFLADGSGGLKVINVANPAAPFFVAAYTTPYAYGIWADSSKIYITDRDLGLLIFDNLLF
jgi:hypothetical protein